MRKQHKRRHPRLSARGPAATTPTFTPVPVRHRHDGWTPARQIAFLQSLAETACVEEAAHAVGMSARSAYTLKARVDAQSFRQAWDLVLDFAAGRLADALLGRAMNGEVTPIFFHGEQIGERRRYDNRLAMWLLAHRQPERYGRWRETLEASRVHPDGAALMMGQAIGRVADDARADEAGVPRTPRPPLHASAMSDHPDMTAAMAELEDQQFKARQEADIARFRATMARQAGLGQDGDLDRDAARMS